MSPIQKIPLQSLNRLPYYLTCLKTKQNNAIESVSATDIAQELSLNEVVVRKDLSLFRSEKGRPNTGFSVSEMILAIEDFLGYHNSAEAVLVGAGRLGRALISGMGIGDFGIRVVAGFDRNERLIGHEVEGVPILPMDKLADLCRRLHIKTAILAVPEAEAQDVCDTLILSGVENIMNYAQVYLKAPTGIYIQNENPSASFVSFFNHLRRQQNQPSVL